jgi:hypothetical protein
MPDTATAIGPVVRMCEGQESHTWDACPGANPLMGLADSLPADMPDDVAVCLFRQNLSLGAPKDTAGVSRITPDGAEFLLHKDLADPMSGQRRWTAIYSGPEMTIDEALAGSPEYEANYDLVTERLRRMRSAGLLDAAVRWREQHPASEVPDV